MRGYDLSGWEDSAPEKRFPVLRGLALVFKAIGWLNFVTVLVVGISMQLLDVEIDPARRLAAYLVMAVVAALGLAWAYLLAESILVILAIEENTRLTAARIRRLLDVPAAGAPEPLPPADLRF